MSYDIFAAIACSPSCLIAISSSGSIGTHMRYWYIDGLVRNQDNNNARRSNPTPDFFGECARSTHVGPFIRSSCRNCSIVFILPPAVNDNMFSPFIMSLGDI